MNRTSMLPCKQNNEQQQKHNQRPNLHNSNKLWKLLGMDVCIKCGSKLTAKCLPVVHIINKINTHNIPQQHTCKAISVTECEFFVIKASNQNRAPNPLPK